MNFTDKTDFNAMISPNWTPATWQEAFAWAGHLPGPDSAATDAAKDRQANLLKPPGALGRLEEIAVWLAGWQGSTGPIADRVAIRVFAGNHGLTAHGVSAYPAEVTAQMVGGFEAGLAAINQLSHLLSADLQVTPLMDLRPTADSTAQAAMTEAQALDCFCQGLGSVPKDCDVLVIGEMGIGNTAVSAALLAQLYDETATDWVGRGTGLNPEGMTHKANIVDQTLRRHKNAVIPADILKCLGGFEFAAMAGAMVGARLNRIPVVLDGFNVTAAAAVLFAADTAALNHVIAGHVSEEQAHRRVLDRLKLDPILDLGMRLGEGSGAATAIPILRAAAACHTGMSTFEEAGVSTKQG